MKETFTRASRNRRVVALMAWAGLVFTAFSLWNSRLSGFIRVVTAEPVAFILAAFAAFVGVFAWMLYNPGRQSAAESPGLFLAMAATLFPPPIIGFCLMPDSSPLRWWLALGIFLLCVIAVLSHVPDEFFNVPRGRNTYFVPIPTFEQVRDKAMDPNAAWFTFSDLTRIVADTDRPSLVPRDYLQQRESVRSGSTTATRKSLMPLSDVDDILGPDFDTDFMSDVSMDYDVDDLPSDPRSHTSHGQYGQRRESTTDRDTQPRRQRIPLPGTAVRRQTVFDGDQTAYRAVNPESLRIAKTAGTHRRNVSAKSDRRIRNQRQRLADSIQIDHSRGTDVRRSGASAGSTGSVFSPTMPVPLPRPRPVQEDRVANSAVNTSYRNSAHTRERTDDQTTRQQTGKTRDRRQKAEKREQQERLEQERLQRKRAERERLQQQKIEQERVERDRRERQETSERLERERIQRERTERERSVRHSSETSRTQRTTDDRDQSPSYRRKGRRSSTDTQAQRSSSDTKSTVARYAAATAVTAVASQTLLPDVAEQDVISKVAESISETKTKPASRRSRQEVPDLSRTRDEHGGELVEGVMKVRFDKGQKRANLHVPFSPPLTGMPDVECECVGGENLRLKVPVRQSYGIRIEARRSNADEAMEADVGFAAIYTPE